MPQQLDLHADHFRMGAKLFARSGNQSECFVAFAELEGGAGRTEPCLGTCRVCGGRLLVQRERTFPIVALGRDFGKRQQRTNMTGLRIQRAFEPFFLMLRAAKGTILHRDLDHGLSVLRLKGQDRPENRKRFGSEILPPQQLSALHEGSDVGRIGGKNVTQRRGADLELSKVAQFDCDVDEACLVAGIGFRGPLKAIECLLSTALPSMDVSERCQAVRVGLRSI